MKVVFADTFYFLALLNREDEAHAPAVELTSNMDWTLVTTIGVTEVGDAMAAPVNRSAFLDLLDVLRTDSKTEIVEELSIFNGGVTLFGDRPDKHWSLTDCISFIVMEKREIKDALTGDHHFVQAGFNALLA